MGGERGVGENPSRPQLSKGIETLLGANFQNLNTLSDARKDKDGGYNCIIHILVLNMHILYK